MTTRRMQQLDNEAYHPPDICVLQSMDPSNRDVRKTTTPFRPRPDPPAASMNSMNSAEVISLPAGLCCGHQSTRKNHSQQPKLVIF